MDRRRGIAVDHPPRWRDASITAPSAIMTRRICLARSERESYAHRMFDQPLEPFSIAFAIATMAIGSAIQASVGIGLALFVVPLLALVDQSFIPGPMLLAGVMLTLMTAYRERTAIDMPALRSSLVGLAIGTVVGAFALSFASGRHLDK